MPGMQPPRGRWIRRGCRQALKPTSTRRVGVISDWSAEFEDPIELPNGRKLITQGDRRNKGRVMQITDDALIAIDVLLEPDRTMTDRSKSLNARLRENYRDGYELDASHMPHVTLLQRFVRTKDLGTVTAAITKALVGEQPTKMNLMAKSIEYVLFAGLAVAVIVIERAPELMRLHHKIADAAEPFSVSGGTAAAFVEATAITQTVDWVETFVPRSSGENYLPHVTVGTATEAFLKQLKAAPFETFTFKPDALAIFQLGNFGTAAKKLWEYQPAGSLSGYPKS